MIFVDNLWTCKLFPVFEYFHQIQKKTAESLASQSLTPEMSIPPILCWSRVLVLVLVDGDLKNNFIFILCDFIQQWPLKKPSFSNNDNKRSRRGQRFKGSWSSSMCRAENYLQKSSRQWVCFFLETSRKLIKILVRNHAWRIIQLGRYSRECELITRTKIWMVIIRN